MQNMFSGAASFNGLIGTWNVSAVTDMTAMFSHASSFNQPIGGWDVSAVTRMGNLFDGAASFNQPIGGWNVSAVTAMNRIFASAVSFDQDLGDWNVSAVTNMSGTFDDTPSLSDANKGKIQSGFSASQDWTYDWSAYVAIPPPNQTGDNNQTDSNPPTDNNKTAPPVDQNSSAPPFDYNSTLFRPLLQTLDREELGDGSIRLWGIILADGKSPVTEVAFEVADNLVFRNSTLYPASMLEGSPNFYAFIILEPGKRYYYRSVATNGMGATYGLPKRFTTPASEANWWTNEPEIPGGWRHSPWLGTFQPYDTGWIYHAKLGWAYAHPDGSGGLWLWMKDHLWTWTQQGVFPYLWKHQSASWHYLLGTQNGQPVFYEWKQSASDKLP
jgi:surface protein